MMAVGIRDLYSASFRKPLVLRLTVCMVVVVEALSSFTECQTPGVRCSGPLGPKTIPLA
jgi:hypothetical protein